MNDYNKIEIQKFAAATKEDCYLLCHNERYYEVSYPIVELLQILQCHENEEDAISVYLEQKQGKYSNEYVVEVINQTIRPLFKENCVKKQRMFIFQKELFAASAIDNLSDTFSFLFKKTCMIPIFISTIILNVFFMLNTVDLLKFNNQINIYTALGLLLFMLSSSFFHEIGHASACKHFGINHGGIGFGLYLNFPVLYTNVTGIWKLDRLQRCIVNIAGVYFQCFILVILLFLFYLTQIDIIRYMILIMNLGFLMTLNPFFKFDGYWIASDLLGVPNLRTRSKELIKYLHKRIHRQLVVNKPYLLQINKIEYYCLIVYSILVNLFMGYYFFYIIPKFIYNFTYSFPDEVEQLILYLSNNMTPPFALLRNIGTQLTFLGLLLFFLITFLGPLVKRYFRHA